MEFSYSITSRDGQPFDNAPALMLAPDKIYNQDCLSGLSQIDDCSIQLTVTSPPYDNLRDYEGYSFPFKSIARELYRVTKQGGVVVWIVGDATVGGSETGTSFRQALFFKELGFRLHDTMLYVKQNPLPQNQRRYEPAFEYMFVLSKGAPSVFNPLCEPCKLAGTLNRGTHRKRSGICVQKSGSGKPVKATKVKSNLWVYPVGKVPGAANHPAVFPEQLASDHIHSWSNEGDTVLDVCSGSGTTACMAKKLGRRFIGFEISQSYCEISDSRLAAI